MSNLCSDAMLSRAGEKLNSFVCELRACGAAAGAPYLRLLKEFSQLFPAISPTPLIASVCFYTPVIRDFCSWCGVRQVGVLLKSRQCTDHLACWRVHLQQLGHTSILSCIWQNVSPEGMQVARKTFVRALRETGSVILVPGGQAELLHTWRLFRRKEFVIHCRHKGQPRWNAAFCMPVWCQKSACM